MIRCALILLLALSVPAVADVRLGKQPSLDENSADGQVILRKRGDVTYIYKKKFRKEDCTWYENKDGSKTKLCRLIKQK